MQHFPKAWMGEIVTSARAITQDIIKKLYQYNDAYEKTHSVDSIARRGDQTNWGNSHVRCMLHCCYLIMFWCLFRYDEALHLEFHQVELDQDECGIIFLKIQLNHRKTHQEGSKNPLCQLSVRCT